MRDFDGSDPLLPKPFNPDLHLGVEYPVRLFGSSYRLVSLEPLTAYLELETEFEGFIALGINRGVAEQLQEVLAMFLAEKPD
ncbi:MAG: hypothetical protein JWR51_4696 [Devosia sp.]|uniref:hypothetical protein n=1 Tax=Devosia sp. TaxID=1871048 RepID=UPI00260C66B4|nr:hypothetical protein [Devosia sp.]MDB5531593.1 hypothetical protein [Devosia sp.]